MSGGVILSTRELPEPFDSLREDYEVRVLGAAASELELAAEIPGVDALVCLVDDAVTGTVIQAADRLRIIASYAVGVDQIDRAAAAARAIVVTNTPNVLTDATADLTMALLFAFAAALQFNDPDPIRWVAIYSAACVLSLLAATTRRRVAPAASLALFAIAIVWAALIAFGGPAASEYGHMFDAWEMKSRSVEEAREASGLLIVAAWMMVLFVRARRSAVRA